MSKRSAKPKSNSKKRYDVEMIRDFLDHLMWEVRTRHFENTARQGTINPELSDQLGKYMKKYGAGLMVANILKHDGLSDDEYREAAANYRQFRVETDNLHLEALESLRDLFEEAFVAAKIPGFPVRELPAKMFLDDEDGDEDMPFDYEV